MTDNVTDLHEARLRRITLKVRKQLLGLTDEEKEFVIAETKRLLDGDLRMEDFEGPKS